MAEPIEKDDPSRAPESGTERDETTGNQPANNGERPLHMPPLSGTASRDRRIAKDDPSVAGEER